MSRELNPPPINPEWSADVRLGANPELKSDIAWGYTLVGGNRQIFEGGGQAANESA